MCLGEDYQTMSIVLFSTPHGIDFMHRIAYATYACTHVRQKASYDYFCALHSCLQGSILRYFTALHCTVWWSMEMVVWNRQPAVQRSGIMESGAGIDLCWDLCSRRVEDPCLGSFQPLSSFLCPYSVVGYRP